MDKQNAKLLAGAIIAGMLGHAIITKYPMTGRFQFTADGDKMIDTATGENWRQRSSYNKDEGPWEKVPFRK